MMCKGSITKDKGGFLDDRFQVQDVWRRDESGRRGNSIIVIAAGDYIVAGLKTDGTVVVAGKYYNGECDGWKDIVAIAADGRVILGLKADGTIVSTPLQDYEADTQRTLNSWKLWN